MGEPAQRFGDANSGGGTIGAAAGSIGGPLAGVTAAGGAIAGGFGMQAAAMETALTFSELLHEEIGEPLTKENIKALLEDEERYNDLIKKAIARGVTIGIIEGITGGLAKGVTSKAVKLGLGDKTAAGAGIIVEGFGGSIGEVAGRIAADQEMEVAEILFEGTVGGAITTPITVFPQLNIAQNAWTNLNIL